MEKKDQPSKIDYSQGILFDRNHPIADRNQQLEESPRNRHTQLNYLNGADSSQYSCDLAKTLAYEIYGRKGAPPEEYAQGILFDRNRPIADRNQHLDESSKNINTQLNFSNMANPSQQSCDLTRTIAWKIYGRKEIPFGGNETSNFNNFIDVNQDSNFSKNNQSNYGNKTMNPNYQGKFSSNQINTEISSNMKIDKAFEEQNATYSNDASKNNPMINMSAGNDGIEGESGINGKKFTTFYNSKTGKRERNDDQLFQEVEDEELKNSPFKKNIINDYQKLTQTQNQNQRQIQGQNQGQKPNRSNSFFNPKINRNKYFQNNQQPQNAPNSNNNSSNNYIQPGFWNPNCPNSNSNNKTFLSEGDQNNRNNIERKNTFENNYHYPFNEEDEENNSSQNQQNNQQNELQNDISNQNILQIRQQNNHQNDFQNSKNQGGISKYLRNKKIILPILILISIILLGLFILFMMKSTNIRQFYRGEMAEGDRSRDDLYQIQSGNGQSRLGHFLRNIPLHLILLILILIIFGINFYFSRKNKRINQIYEEIEAELKRKRESRNQETELNGLLETQIIENYANRLGISQEDFMNEYLEKLRKIAKKKGHIKHFLEVNQNGISDDLWYIP